MNAIDAVIDKALEKGFDRLDEAELLGLLTGSLDIGMAIIRRYGSLWGMAKHPLEEFLAIPGLGDARILRIAAAFEIARRCAKHAICPNPAAGRGIG